MFFNFIMWNVGTIYKDICKYTPPLYSFFLTVSLFFSRFFNICKTINNTSDPQFIYFLLRLLVITNIFNKFRNIYIHFSD
jgi:hypothetical protein